MPAALGPLWRCPKCRAKLVTRNPWHSVGRIALEALFARSHPSMMVLGRKFIARVKRATGATMIPQKSRLAVMDRVRFASVYPRKKHPVVGFVFKRRIRDARLAKIEPYGPGVFHHYLNLSSAAEIDARLLSWLRESSRYCGRQERLQ